MVFLILGAFLYLAAFLGFTLRTFRKIGSERVPKLLLTLALLSYVFHIAYKYASTQVFPVGDFHGTAALIGNFLVAVFVVMLVILKKKVEDFGFAIAFVGFLTTMLGLPATKGGFTDPLFISHLISAAGSYAFIIFGGITSALKLFIEKRLKGKHVSSLFLPLSVLRKIERTSVNLSFIFLTLTLVFGSLWTKSFLGKHWINDHKLIFTLLIWFYYAVMVHLNIVKGIKPSRFSYLSLFGFVLSIGGILWIRHTEF